MNEITVDKIPDDAILLDVREDAEFRAGHAENAVHIPLGTIPVRVADLPKVEGTLPVICRSGGRSGQAVQWLAEQGHDVANVVGGMGAWQAAGKAMVAESGTPEVL